MANVTAWSFSRWALYSECPARYKFKNIDRLPEPEGPALARGTMIHNLVQKFVDDAKAKFPTKAFALENMRTPLDGERDNERIKKVETYLKGLRKVPGASELDLAFDSNWQKVDWFARNAWCRVKIDRIAWSGTNSGVTRVVDYKTGKIRGEYVEQLELYGLTGLIVDPKALKASGELYFIDAGEIVKAPNDYKMGELPKLKKKWEGRVKKLLNDTRFDPNPGSACRFCAYAKKKGGPCQY